MKIVQRTFGSFGVEIVECNAKEGDPWEVEPGDCVVVSIDGNKEVGEIKVNPSNKEVIDMQEKVVDMSETLARAAMEDNGEDPEKWVEYLSDGYPRMVWYNVNDECKLELFTEDTELINREFEMPI